MNNETLTLSVIVPVYNVEEYLLPCLASIDRSIKNIEAEVLLIDDGSTDSSPSIAKDYLKEHPKFRYFHKENGGLAQARNYGVKRAAGKYISFVDSDDIVTEDMYESMIASAELHNTDFTIINLARLNSKRVYKSFLYSLVFKDLEKTVTHITESDSLIFDTIACNKLIKKSFWDDNHFEFPEGWRFEDMAVSFAMHCQARKVSVVRTVGYLWRARDGETKSITQENSSVTNLKHRLHMLECIFNYIDIEMNGDKRLLRLLSQKILTVDLILYINEIGLLTRSAQEEYRDIITSFLKLHFDEKSFENLSAIDRQKYADLLSGRFDEIEPLKVYGKREYYSAPVIEQNKERLMVLHNALFDEDFYSVKNEVELIEPTHSIMDINFVNSCILIDMYSYLERINVEEGEQKINASLVNIVSGKELSLCVETIVGTNVSKRYGKLYDLYNGEQHEYNYDGSAFRVNIDLETVSINKDFFGNNILVIHYSNTEKEGSFFVRIDDESVIKRFKNDRFESDQCYAVLSFDAQGCLKIGVAQNDELSEKAEAKKEHSAVQVINTRLTSKDTIEITLSFDNSAHVKDDKKLYLEYFDRLTGNRIRLAESQATHEDSREAGFKIAFSNWEERRNLYDMRTPIFIHVEDGASWPITIKRNLCRSLDTDNLVIGLVSDDSGVLLLDIRKTDYITKNQKAYYRKYCYPKYFNLPINDKTIIFESYWGSQYSCNPRALYEYIDANHPEYTCVWSLEDERTPIKGRGIRVRKYSDDYYRYLATARFLVNNVNFEQAYRKREGQIEIQTMHGTPFKTVGLDAKDEFKTEEERIKYVKRNRRWNYLIAQGVFTEKNANQWYGFNKTILKTGYPRTDKLYHVDAKEKTIIKGKLSLPKEKKVILYVPTFRQKGIYEMPLDLGYLKRELGEDYIILIRLHHFAAGSYKVPTDDKFIYDACDYNCVEDLYKIADILITDYSSVMFDFAITDKPMIFYAYDLEEYRNKTRGIYFDINTEAPGPVVYTTKGIVEAIISNSDYSDRIKLFKEKYLTYESDNSCEKIFKEAIQKQKVNRAISFRLGIIKLAKVIIPKEIYSKIRTRRLTKEIK